MYTVAKTFGHDLGLSACFRQHAARGSHCRQLHGYALSIELIVHAPTLDARNWVIDFGDFQKVKHFLVSTFDHKLLVAADDPDIALFKTLETVGAASVLVLPSVGCEAFAAYVFESVAPIIHEMTEGRAKLFHVSISEHGANRAGYSPSR